MRENKICINRCKCTSQECTSYKCNDTHTVNRCRTAWASFQVHQNQNTLHNSCFNISSYLFRIRVMSSSQSIDQSCGLKITINTKYTKQHYHHISKTVFYKIQYLLSNADIYRRCIKHTILQPSSISSYYNPN